MIFKNIIFISMLFLSSCFFSGPASDIEKQELSTLNEMKTAQLKSIGKSDLLLDFSFENIQNKSGINF